MTTDYETATLAAGCFWCVEAVFDDLKGVRDVVSGYSGGHKENPTYQEVCSETTGHAEVVQIRFDPKELTLKELLQVFFTIHDPTTLNRQGGDIGTSYRSAIFYHSDEQRRIADEVIAEFTAEGVAKKIYFWTGCNGLWTLQKFLDRIIPTNARGKVRRRSENPSGCQTRIVEEYDCLTMEFFQENCMGCAPASIIVTWK